MKKMLKSLIAIFLVLGLLVACGGESDSNDDATVKVGVASTQKVAETRDEEDNGVEFTTTVAGVTLKDDKVAYISIDVSQQFAQADGETVTAEALPTKKQRGSDYGMLGASEAAGLGKEWDDQIAGIEEDLIGKTLEEVKEYFGGEEIKSSATIVVDHIEETVVKSIDSAVEVEGVEKVGLGYNVSVQVKGDGLKPESVLEYAMVAVNADGEIVEALLDNAQEKAELVDGSWDLININQTKGELKEDYGMLVASPIEKEWYEQNDAMMETLEGLTFDEALGLTLEDEDLQSSVTMVIDGIQASLAHAQENLQELK